MTILDIVTYPAKILAKPAKKVENIDESIIRLVEDMADTMYEAPGVGLAAVQVGVDKCIIVYDDAKEEDKREHKALINPVIISREGEFISESEGCLSVPELRADVKRAVSVVVEGLNLDGEPVRIEAEGITSVIMQHEIDHLNGILFIDHISALKRNLYKKRVEKRLKSIEK